MSLDEIIDVLRTKRVPFVTKEMSVMRSYLCWAVANWCSIKIMTW